MRTVGILGSTGTIGCNALKVIEHLQMEVSVLAAHSNIDLLEEQAKVFHPEVVAVFDEQKARELQTRLPQTTVLGGREGILAASTHPSFDLLLNAVSGFDGVELTLKAIQAEKDIALANKESLTCAGSLVVEKARISDVALIPVDSELTAVFQCLKGEEVKDARRIILTASGGPFREYGKKRLETIAVEEALSHPNYEMGPKVLVDSSTLMNKGFELIATHVLYNLPVEVVIHPEQIIHSMVEFSDCSIIAQMGSPNMLVPIQVALTHPQRKKGISEPFDFQKAHNLHFAPWDGDRFRCLNLSYQALREGGSMPCFMNGANEILVKRFLSSEITWLEIGQKLETLMETHKVAQPKQYDELALIDQEARLLAERI